MSGMRGKFVYHSDDTATYNVSIDSSNAVAGGFTAAAAGAQANKPGNMKMRYVLARHPTTGRERKVYIASPASALYVGGTATVDLEDFTTSPSAVVTYAIAGRIGERRFNR